MPPNAVLGLGTEGGKLLVEDYRNWKKTGWKPNAKVLGPVAHYRSRNIYQEVSSTTFRKAAQKAANHVLALMTKEQIEEMEMFEQNEGEEHVIDPINRNKFVQAKQMNEEEEEQQEDSDDEENEEEEDNEDDEEEDGGTSIEEATDDDKENQNEEEEEEDDDDDDDWVANDYDSSEEFEDYCDGAIKKHFNEMSLYELKGLTEPIVCVYPNNSKVGIVFICEGDVKDMTSNQFEFSDDGKALTRFVRVPKERLNAVSLIGDIFKGDERKQNDDFGYTDGDIMMLQGVIDRRLKNLQGYQRDADGNIWEEKDKICLPFPCSSTLYDKTGTRIKKYVSKRNKKGFTWGFFWLLPIKKDSLKQPRRIAGQKVSADESSSMYSYDDETLVSEESRMGKRHRMMHHW